MSSIIFVRRVLTNIFLLLAAFLSLYSCKTIFFDSGKSVEFGLHDSETLRVTMKSPRVGWIGVGLGKSGMTNVDMNLAEFKNSTNFNLVDLWSLGKKRPVSDISLGGKSDLFGTNYTFDGKIYTLTYLRKLDTGDDYDFIVPLDEDFRISVSWGSNETMSYHGKKTYHKSSLFISEKNLEKMKLVEKAEESSTQGQQKHNTKSSNEVNPELYYEKFTYHGVLLSISWSFMNFTGIIFARFKRDHNSWLVYHQIGSGLAAFYSLLSGYLAYNLLNEELKLDHSSDPTTSYHHLIGFTIMGLSFFQIVGGYSIYFFGSSSWFIALSRGMSLRKLHKYFGFLTTIIAKVEMVLGLLIFWPSYLALILVTTLIEILLFIHYERTSFVEEDKKE